MATRDTAIKTLVVEIADDGRRWRYASVVILGREAAGPGNPSVGEE